jgi:hypothetical protein
MDSGTSAHMLAMDRGAREVELESLRLKLPKLIAPEQMPMMSSPVQLIGQVSVISVSTERNDLGK